jgi:uncharacterized protein
MVTVAAALCHPPVRLWHAIPVRPRFDVITLGVASLERSLAFYRDGLGWPTDGVVGTEFHDDLTGADGAIAFLPLENGIQIALYQRDDLAKDAQIPLRPSGSPQFSLIHQVGSREEVDHVIGEAVAAGGRLTAPPRMRPYGFYSGYIQDPDGHLWEIGWNSRP